MPAAEAPTRQRPPTRGRINLQAPAEAAVREPAVWAPAASELAVVVVREPAGAVGLELEAVVESPGRRWAAVAEPVALRLEAVAEPVALRLVAVAERAALRSVVEAEQAVEPVAWPPVERVVAGEPQLSSHPVDLSTRAPTVAAAPPVRVPQMAPRVWAAGRLEFAPTALARPTERPAAR